MLKAVCNWGALVPPAPLGKIRRRWFRGACWAASQRRAGSLEWLSGYPSFSLTKKVPCLGVQPLSLHTSRTPLHHDFLRPSLPVITFIAAWLSPSPCPSPVRKGLDRKPPAGSSFLGCSVVANLPSLKVNFIFSNGHKPLRPCLERNSSE